MIRSFLTVALLGAVAPLSGGENAEPPVSSLKVELRPYPEEESIYNRNPVIVRFTNTTNKPVRILRPLDGSLWGWHMPHYKLDVAGEDGKPLKLGSRCGVSGLWADMQWPNDYMVTLRPKESFEKEIGIHHVIPADGEYTVTFSYTYLADKTNLPAVTYPDNLWGGTATSKPIQLKLKK